MGTPTSYADIYTVITTLFVPFFQNLFTSSVISYVILFSIGLTVIGSLVYAVLRR